MKRIHIVGSGPRTGTTLVAEVMHTCFDIDHHCQHEAPICTDEPEAGDVFLTKQPGDILSIRWPLRLNRQLFVICIVRDPRDAIVSNHGSKPGVYWTGLRYWKAFRDVFDEFTSHPRFLWFRYEDFVINPDEIQRQISGRLSFLATQHAFSEYHLHANPSERSLKALKAVRPIAPAGVGAWKRHLPRVKQQLRVHSSITQDLIRFGYERDRNWERCLDSVTEGEFTTARPEHLSQGDLRKHRQRELREVANIAVRSIGLNPARVRASRRSIYLMLKRFTGKHGGDKS